MTDSNPSDRNTGDPVAATSGMDAELKRKWVEALRSGQYKQGYWALHSVYGFCCLGVLNNVASRNQNYDFSELGIDGAAQEHLIELNDYRRKSFPSIADYIEANIPVRA